MDGTLWDALGLAATCVNDRQAAPPARSCDERRTAGAGYWLEDWTPNRGPDGSVLTAGIVSIQKLDGMTTSHRTHYAKTRDGIAIAYQVVGDGPVDLALLGPWLGNVEVTWDVPALADFWRSLASFSRLIIHDMRGTGLSDRPPGAFTLESQVEDMLAVLDDMGSSRTCLFAGMNAGAAAALFAAQYPDRTAAFIWYAPAPRATWAEDYPWGEKPEEYQAEFDAAMAAWGSDDAASAFFGQSNPSLQKNRVLVTQLSRLMRHFASPMATAEIWNGVWTDIDVRHVLPSIRVPALVIDRDGVVAEEGEYAASLIPGCQRVVLKGDDALAFLGDSAPIVDTVRDFLGVPRPVQELDRVLSTVLFTDIVGSTKKACEVGDACWKELLERHGQVTRAMLARYRGTEVNTTGDGFLATFDGPARAVKCAQAICEAVKPLGLEVRAGCHTGEIELMGNDVGGVAVHIAARVAALAASSEVLVSSTLKDLTAGSGLAFEDRGEHVLKGVPGSWHLYAVEH
jgi:class 3 adenylate cyclase